MGNEYRIEGITLLSKPYSERERIITVFSKEYGLISLIAKFLTIKKPSYLTLTTPFCSGEFIYQKTKSDLHIFKDGSVLDEFHAIKNDFDRLQVACKLAKAVLSSQITGKKTNIFILLKSYLKQLTHISNPYSLLLSFYLKILVHDNFLSFNAKCNQCKENNTTHIFSGESLCEKHAPKTAFSFSEEAINKIIILLFSKKFSDFDTLETEKHFIEKIENLFHDIVL